MKKIIIFIILILSAGFIYAQEIFMYEEDGKKVFFQRSDSLLQIRFKDNLYENEKRNITLSFNLEYSDKLAQINRMIINPDKNAKFDVGKLTGDNRIVYINQSLINSEGIIVIPTNKVMVQVKDGYELENILKNWILILIHTKDLDTLKELI
jgi:hypothetical protein